MWQLQYPDQKMNQLINLVEWHYYPAHAVSRDPPANFWMDRHHRSLLPVGLMDLCQIS